VSDEAFRTVAGRGRASFRVRGSEFVGHVAPAASVEAAEAIVDEVRDDHPDATHVVPASRVRADALREHSSDDGEPSGSAGKPALNVLQGDELENVVAVVVRYFGGTELGVGGLVRAYGRSVKLAVADAGTVEREPHEHISITVDYDDSGTVRGILESAGADFDADYAERVGFAVTVPRTDVDALCDRLRSATGGRAAIEGC
jgi:uncharacterized YigZ family protein